MESMETGLLGVDKRKFPRAQAELEVRFKATSEADVLTHSSPEVREWVSAWSQNISGGGLALSTRAQLRDRQIIKIDFRLPEQPKPIRAFAEVMWTTQVQEKLYAGIHFIAVKEEDVEALSHFVVDLLHKNGAF